MRLNIKKNRLSVSIILFLIIFLIIVQFKPAFLFNRDGSIRKFGLGKSNTSIIPIWLLCILIAILSYLLILYLTSFNII
jgi:hypothetical protein